ncbi:Cell wall hydrolase/autolysin, partial [human gut metagenome]
RVDGNKLDEMYTVERNMKQISVYDENDIVVWNGEEGIYSTVGGTTLKLGWTKVSFFNKIIFFHCYFRIHKIYS